MWEIHIQHEGLLASRVLKGHSYADTQAKADRQSLLWDQQWAHLHADALAHAARSTPQRLRLHGNAIAARLTAEVTAHLAALNSLLESSLSTGSFFKWDILKDTGHFAIPPVASARLLPPPARPPKSRFALANKLIPSRATKTSSSNRRYDQAITAWRTACLETAEINRCAIEQVQRLRDRRAAEKKLFDSAQLAQHASVSAAHTRFLHHDQHEVEYYFSEVLSRSHYPRGFPREAHLHYVRATRDLFVEYELPSITAWPTFKEVRYNPARSSLHNMPASDLANAVAYEDALYQIPLRALSELFAHDDAQTLDCITFNGWVRAIDKSTGTLDHRCVMSVRVARADFSAINLSKVEPSACFKKLEGTVCRDLLDPESIEPQAFSELETAPFLHTEVFTRSGPNSNLISIDRSLLAH